MIECFKSYPWWIKCSVPIFTMHIRIILFRVFFYKSLFNLDFCIPHVIYTILCSLWVFCFSLKVVVFVLVFGIFMFFCNPCSWSLIFCCLLFYVFLCLFACLVSCVVFICLFACLHPCFILGLRPILYSVWALSLSLFCVEP